MTLNKKTLWPFKLTLLCVLAAFAAACEPDPDGGAVESRDVGGQADVDAVEGRDTSGQTADDTSATLSDTSREDTRVVEDTFDTGEDADVKPDGEVVEVPSYEAHIQAVYWVAAEEGAPDAVPMLAVEVVGLPFDRVANAQVTVTGSVGVSETPLSASVTGKMSAQVGRVGSGPSWSAPIQGEAALSLLSASGDVRQSRVGRSGAGSSARFDSIPADPSTGPVVVNAYLKPRATWTDAGLTPINAAPTWEALFALRASVGRQDAALSESASWLINVNEEQVCNSRTGCDVPIFAATRHSGELSPAPFTRFLVPLPEAVGVEGGRGRVDVSLGDGDQPPVEAFAVVIGLNNTKKDKVEPVSAVLDESGSSASIPVPFPEIAGVTMHLIPTLAAPTTDGGPRVGVQSVLAVAWDSVDRDWSAGSPRLRLSDPTSEAWALWPEVPVHSVQALSRVVVDVAGDPTGSVYGLEVGDDPEALGALALIAGAGVARCDASALATRGYGVCARWERAADQWALSVTAFSFDGDALPAAAPARLFALAAGGEPGPSPTDEALDLSFDPDHAAVFAIEVGLQPQEGAALHTLLASPTVTSVRVEALGGPAATGTATGALVLADSSLALAPAADAARLTNNRAFEAGAPVPYVVEAPEGSVYTIPPLVLMQTGAGARGVAVTASGVLRP